jgi:hypothetical protein
MNGENIVAAIPIDAPGYKPANDNYTRINCESCNADCWIGPNQKALATHSKLSVLCINCICELYGEDLVKNANFQHAPERN